MSQQNGELKKLLEIPVPWFPGSLASVKHAREFCYAESKTAAPLVLLTSASRGVLPRDTAIIEVLLRGSTASKLVSSATEQIPIAV